MLSAPRTDISFNFSKAAVLAVDANPMCLDVLSGILNGFGFKRVQRATELEGARRIARTQDVDLMLIDPYPYGEDAFHFMRWFRTERAGLHAAAPVLIISGHTCMSLITETMGCGADYVVAKPFSTSALLDRILWVAQNDLRQSVMIDAPEDIASTGSEVEIW